jgi:curved DNA-binding protein CbpA
LNPYEELGLNKSCTEAEVKQAYRDLSKIHHPDVGGDASKFSRISISANILRDPDKKKLYDESGTIDDSSIDNLVRERFTEMINSWINFQLSSSREISLDKHIKSVIKENNALIADAEKDMNKDIAKLEKMKKRIKCKDKENTVENILEAKITDLLSNKGALSTQKFILDMLEKKGSLYSSYEEMNKDMHKGTEFNFLGFSKFGSNWESWNR